MLTGRGFSDIAAKGILGNMFQESKFDPDVYQSTDSGVGRGRGLLQWETGGRFDTDPLNLIDFAKKQEKSWRDPEVQLDFMIAEMDKSAGLTPESAERQNYQYDMARTMMNQANTPEEAAEIFSNLYLKPGKAHMDTRTAYASGFEPRTTQVAQAEIPPVLREVPKEEEGNFLSRAASRAAAAIFGGDEEPSTKINMDLVYSDDNKAAMSNASKYLFMGDIVKAGGDLIDSIKQGTAEPTPETNAPDEYKVIEQLLQKGYTKDQVSAILRGEDVPMIQDPVDPLFKEVPQYTGQGSVGESMVGNKPGSLVSGMPTGKEEVPELPKIETPKGPTFDNVPQYTPQGSVGESMMGTKPGSLVSGMTQKGKPTVEVPKPAEVSLIPNSAKGFGYLLEGIQDALVMSPGELLEATKDAAVGGPENRNVPENGAIQIPDGPQADEYDKRLLEDARKDVEKVEKETIFGDVDKFDVIRASNTAADASMKIDKEVEKQEELKQELDKQIKRGNIDPGLVAAVEEQNKKVQQAETKGLAAIAGARKEDVKKAEEADKLKDKATSALGGSTPSDKPDGKPDPKPDPKPDAKDDKKNKALGGLGAFKELTDAQKKGLDDVTNIKKDEIPESLIEKATSTLKGIFGDMFDTQELARMGVTYAASRLMGYDQGTALQFSAKNYMSRVDAKVGARNEFVTSEAALKRFTPESLQEYKKTGDMKKLVQKPVAGKPIKDTGEMQTFYPVGGGRPVKAKKVTQDGKTFYVTGDGKVVNQFAFHTDPAKVPGTDEYRKKVSDSGETYTGYLNELKDSMGEGDTTKINTGVNGRNIAEWQVKHDVPEEVMGRVVDMAYRSALAEGDKINNIVPYLESAYIKAAVGDSTLFTTKDGKPASSEKILDAVDMGVALVRQNPAAEGKSSEQIKNDMLALMRQKYDTLTVDEKAIYNEEAGNDESGFLTFMLEQIEEAQGKVLGVY